MSSVDPIAWPIAQLPFFAEHGSWVEAPEPNVIDFEVDVGPPKRRRRSYIPARRVQFSQVVTSEQLATFLSFYEGNLKSGVLNFTAIDPRTGENTEYQFLGQPSWRDITSNGETSYWRLQFALRKVNVPPAEVLEIEGSGDGIQVLQIE